MSGWTTNFPSFADEFLAEDPNFIHRALDQRPEIQKDYSHKLRTRHPNLPADNLVPMGDVVPNGYGFAVTDFVTKRIVTCWHFFPPFEIDAVRCFLFAGVDELWEDQG
jgi:hypothetical protein